MSAKTCQQARSSSNIAGNAGMGNNIISHPENIPDGTEMKKIFLIITLIILLAGLPILVWYVMREQDLRSKAAPATALSFSPDTVTAKTGENFTLNVIIDTGTNTVYYTDLIITYDPNILEAQSIVNGPIFPSVLSNSLTGEASSENPLPAGIVSVGGAVALPAEPFSGYGTAATVTFKALTATSEPTIVQFSKSAAHPTVIGPANDPETNVLQSAGVARITITGTTEQTAMEESDDTSSTEDDRLFDEEATASAETESDSANETDTANDYGTDDDTANSVSITTPTENDGLTDPQPEIAGTAPPRSTVTITIYSEPQTAVVTADSSGNWSYTPETPLEPGPHDIVITVQAADGKSYTATQSFVVAGGTETATTETGVPIAGSATPTYLAVILGLTLLFSGSLFIRKSR